MSSNRAHSGSLAFLAEDVASISDQFLLSPWIFLPASWTSSHLRFWHYRSIESGTAGICWDGGVVEISEDGVQWIALDGQLRTDPADGVVSSCCSNPLQNRQAWCGEPSAWRESVVDLQPWVGRNVRLRFRLGTDETIGQEGWYVDDISIRACQTATEIFVDGFESGTTGAWSGTTTP